MRLLRLISFIGLAVLLASCSCRTKRVETGENIPVASEGSELRDVNYAFDKYDIDQGAASILEQNASWLNANASVNVEIEGHTDERGTNEYNMALGARRAKAVYDYLRSLGVSASRMRTVSYGEELPLDPRHNEEAWAKNRRAHFNILK
jgi:peptidoglycan-associated lipoprotein